MPKHFSTYQRAKVSALFERENEYKRHMNNLYRTREGLSFLLQNRPELAEIIQPQFDTLNYLINALLPPHPSDSPGYPPYHDVFEDVPGSDDNLNSNCTVVRHVR